MFGVIPMMYDGIDAEAPVITQLCVYIFITKSDNIYVQMKNDALQPCSTVLPWFSSALKTPFLM